MTAIIEWTEYKDVSKRRETGYDFVTTATLGDFVVNFIVDERYVDGKPVNDLWEVHGLPVAIALYREFCDVDVPECEKEQFNSYIKNGIFCPPFVVK